MVGSRLLWCSVHRMAGRMGTAQSPVDEGQTHHHEHVLTNPVMHVQTRSKSSYRAIVLTPQQTLTILNSLPAVLHRTLVLTCAATALRSSEILALRWADILWEEKRIRVSKRWVKGADGETKTEASDGYVPLHPVLANHLQRWRNQTPHKKDKDFVF